MYNKQHPDSPIPNPIYIFVEQQRQLLPTIQEPRQILSATDSQSLVLMDFNYVQQEAVASSRQIHPSSIQYIVGYLSRRTTTTTSQDYLIVEEDPRDASRTLQPIHTKLRKAVPDHHSHKRTYHAGFGVAAYHVNLFDSMKWIRDKS